MDEIWRNVKDYEGLYQVSNFGRVKSLARTIIRSNGWLLPIKERILKIFIDKQGYYTIKIMGHLKYVHRLVAEAFIPNPLNKPEVNHKDGDKSNNNDWNLEWCTSKENDTHARDMKLKIGCKGIHRKVTDIQINEIKQIGYSMTQRQISKIYNVDGSTICRIRKTIS